MKNYSKENFREFIRQNSALVFSLLIVVFCVLSILIYKAGRNIVINAAKDAYNEASASAYDQHYQEFYDRGEAAYHVNNEVTIVIGPIEEKSELEVLTVGATVFVNSGETVWEEISGTSSYTVNLKAAEYAVDNQRKTVYIRLPEPQLKEKVSIDEDHLHVYELIGDGKINNLIQDITGSIQQGEAEAVEMRKKGSSMILSKIMENNAYFNHAKTAAESIIKNLVVSVNPNVSDIRVEVDFY